MTDIVERLRDQGKDAFAKHYSLGMFKLCTEAADEIERLRKALDGSAEQPYLISILDSGKVVFEECPECKGHGRVGVMACFRCGATGQALSPANQPSAEAIENKGGGQS